MIFKLFKNTSFLLKSKFSTSSCNTTSTPIYKRIFNNYVNSLNTRPLLTKSITSLTLYFTADLVSQYGNFKSTNSTNDSLISNELNNNKSNNVTNNNNNNNVIKVDKVFEIDYTRLITFSLMGGLFTGPSLHIWYGMLSRSIPGLGLVSICKRLAFDQILFAPFFISTFFCVALILENKIENIQIKLKNDLMPTLITNYILWIPAQFINFRFILPQFQVLFATGLGFFWNIYFSSQTAKGNKDKEING
jgi:hypothetical protein